MSKSPIEELLFLVPLFNETRSLIHHLRWAMTATSGPALVARVARARRKNLGRGLPTDYWSLDLPKETRAYVPRVMALAR